MENNILIALQDLKCPHLLTYKNGSESEDAAIPPILGDWINYSNIISWVGEQLKRSLKPLELEERVNPITNPNEELPSFKMELSGMLKELGCPYTSIMDPPLTSRFETVESRSLVLNFLLGEVQAIRMLKKGAVEGTEKPNFMEVELSETEVAKGLRELCQELDLGKPPEGITEGKVWSGIISRMKGGRLKDPLDPLFTSTLSPSLWDPLGSYFEELKADYKMRREMLLKRLDVTIQSFHWSERIKGMKIEGEMEGEFKKIRPLLGSEPGVKLVDVLGARVDLPVVEKASSTSVRKNTRSRIHDVRIGRVPDRGGRTDEVEPPPPEMPSWQQRQGPPSSSSGWIQNPNQPRGGGRGGGGGYRGGGRVQGGWSQPPHQSQSQGHGHGHGGGGGDNYYHQGGGGYYQHQNQQDGYQGQYQSQNQSQGYRGGGGYRGGRDNRRY